MNTENTGRLIPGIAVVGAGYWGINHVRNYMQMEVLQAVCDTDPGCVDRITKLYPNLRIEPDYERLLRDPAVNGIVIATPAETHYHVARHAIEAGKDVLVEKPLTLDVDKGLELVERAASKRAVLMVGHLLEYHPAVLRLRALISSGALGEI
ncbi:MAG TPA: Gfo/Idh/MocA family oxidoreductase, partial [Blastocatellia bacterium]